MNCKQIHLNESFPFLKQENCDPILDIFLPCNLSEIGAENRKHACLIICPGGGYSYISDREGEPVAMHFLPRGYNVFVLHYSVAPHGRFPQQMLEIATIIELINQNAEAWHCDTDKIALAGFSAGGHLAAQYSTMYDCPEVRQYINSKPVNASILSYPVITAGEYAHIDSFRCLLGREHLTSEEIARFSLENQVSEHTPPTFLWHTADDNCVPVENTLLYASALSKHHVSFEMHIYPEGNHGLSTADRETCTHYDWTALYRVREWIDAAARWLQLQFYGEL